MADAVEYFLIDPNGNNLLKREGGLSVFIGNDAGEWYYNFDAGRFFYEANTELIPLTEEQAKKEADRIWGKGKHKMFG